MGLFGKSFRKKEENGQQGESANEDKIIAYHRRSERTRESGPRKGITEGEDFISGAFENGWGFYLRRARYDTEGNESPSAPWVLSTSKVYQDGKGHGEWYQSRAKALRDIPKDELKFTLGETEDLIKVIKDMAYYDQEGRISRNRMDSVKKTPLTAYHGFVGDEINLEAFLLQDKKEREARFQEIAEKNSEEARKEMAAFDSQLVQKERREKKALKTAAHDKAHKRKAEAKARYNASKGRLLTAKGNKATAPGIMLENPKEVKQVVTAKEVKKKALQKQMIDSLSPDK